jgi:hypothetical protein
VTELAPGDLVRYTTEAGDEFMLGVVGIAVSNEQQFAIVRVVEWTTLDPNLSTPTNVRVLTADHPFALMPYRGQDLPKRRSTRFASAWNLPDRERYNGLVGSSAVSWGSNLDWQLRKVVESAGIK